MCLYRSKEMQQWGDALMKVVRSSSLGEYARYFYDRERLKNPRLPMLGTEQQCADWIESHHKYKLPYEGMADCRVDIEELDRNDVERLVIHDYMVDPAHDGGKWITERGLTPVPSSTVIKDLANRAIEVGYFTRPLPQS